MSAYNTLIFQQGGMLFLDERLTAKPTEATITLTTVDQRSISEIDPSFTTITDAPCVIDDLVITLPAKQAPWKVVVPTNTDGTIGDLTGEGRKLLLNRGGRKFWLRVSEYDTSGSDIIEMRFDEGIDAPIKAGDTLTGIRVSYNVDWSSVSAEYTGKIKAVWKVKVDGVWTAYTKLYDVVRQILEQPATWSDVLNLRPDADDQLSQIRNKEALVTRAWNDVVRDLYVSGIRYNLIIPDENTILRDITVLQCVYNLVMFQGLSIPESYIGQGDRYIEELGRSRARFMGNLKITVDQNSDGKLTTKEMTSPKKQIWFRRNRLLDMGGD